MMTVVKRLATAFIITRLFTEFYFIFVLLKCVDDFAVLVFCWAAIAGQMERAVQKNP